MGTFVRITMLLVFALSLSMSAAFADECDAEQEEISLIAMGVDIALERGVTENAKGTVYYYEDRGPEVWATIGSRNGLRPTASVAFVRKGEIVAEGTVKEARHSDCIIKPAPNTPAGTILIGDDVFVMMNGPREALDAQIRREHRKTTMDALMALLGLAGLIVAAR